MALVLDFATSGYNNDVRGTSSVYRNCSQRATQVRRFVAFTSRLEDDLPTVLIRAILCVLLLESPPEDGRENDTLGGAKVPSMPVPSQKMRRVLGATLSCVMLQLKLRERSDAAPLKLRPSLYAHFCKVQVSH